MWTILFRDTRAAMDEVILSRHAESEYSVRGAVNGDPAVAVALTETGRAQARALRDLLRAEPIDLCVTSAFQRVRETADLALEGRDVPRLVLDDLNDIGFGDYEGRTLGEYRVWAGTALPDDVASGAESRAGAARRYARGLRTVLERPERLVLVVAHSLPIRYVLNAVAGVSPTPILDLVPYAGAERLRAAELDAAVTRLEEWCAAPAW
jgi:broad specificity phosphatase PhoE